MLRTLYAKLGAALAVLFLIVGGLFILLLVLSTGLYRQELNQQLGRDLAANLLAEHPLYSDGKIDHTGLEQMFHDFMVINPSIEVYLLDNTGHILAFSAPPGTVQIDQVDIYPIKRFLSNGERLPILGDDPRDLNQHKIFSVASVDGPGGNLGYLYVILGGQYHDNPLNIFQGSYIAQFSLLALSAILIFGLSAGLLVFRVMTGRFNRLCAEMDTFKQSGFSTFKASGKPPSMVGDEIDDLTHMFHEMAKRIVDQMNRLKNTDAMRRELVANVSHDLRTPLASLQGYLETLLLKGDDLTSEDRNHYLNVAMKHSERLNGLISELFELARLDSDEVKPHREPFSLAELVQDVVQKYYLQAQARGIILESDFDPRLPFVDADIALIERVLENLIQNALRYTPQGGTVRISLVPETNTVAVSVSDTGQGIPAEDLPHIFERFYRAEKERSSSGGTGLGLAIARRIIELHGSVISATSALNAGSTFSFRLPTYSPS